MSKLRECVAENPTVVEPTMEATELLVKGEKPAFQETGVYLSPENLQPGANYFASPSLTTLLY